MRKVLSLCLAACVLFSCKKEGSVEQPSTANGGAVYPLKVGNQWTYTVTYYDEDGKVDATETETHVVTGTEKINNQTYYVLVDAQTKDTLQVLRSDANGVYMYDKDFGREFTFFKSPAKEGEVIASAEVSPFRVEYVSSAGTTSYSGYESSKVTITTFMGGLVPYYGELFIKPGIGETGERAYTLKLAGNGHYMDYDMVLSSYTLK
ncbi:hypothetical protein V9K67_14245 [Paraflavisolibacter sp. H34]|uniref:hypothetical protein n=1 Tax=Huijunlia imazamoxiresistens TaxID=3127457 RepID=UPI00301957EB